MKPMGMAATMMVCHSSVRALGVDSGVLLSQCVVSRLPPATVSTCPVMLASSLATVHLFSEKRVGNMRGQKSALKEAMRKVVAAKQAANWACRIWDRVWKPNGRNR